MRKPAYAIVGCGIAATSAAESLRGEGFDGRIVMIGDEPEAPYERPPLSKELLRGEREQASIALRAPDFYERNAIELRRSTQALELVPSQGLVRCTGGQDVRFDKLLIATGASPRRLGSSASGRANIYYLRTLSDALSLRAALGTKPRVLVVGTGFIGCEVAASSHQLGCEVTVVGRSQPMEHVLGPEMAALYADYYVARGITIKTNATVTAFRGDKVVEAARLSDGSELACDVVIVGIGVAPAIGWLGSHLAVSDGVDTDELCRTSDPRIFAAGDVACSWRPRLNQRVRLEHFDNAESQGAAAGRAMHGNVRPYDPIPFFWSDQYDLSLQYYGYARHWNRVVLRRYPSDNSLIAFYLNDGQVDAACLLNRSQDANAIKRLIGRNGVNVADLADSTKPLIHLLPTPSAQ